MKKLIILIGIILICGRLSAPNFPVCYLLVSSPVQPYEALIQAVVQVESGGDNYAYNKKEGAYGAFQIRAIRLRDFNKRTGKHYKLTDMYDYDKAKEVFLTYVTDDLERSAKSWNGSGYKTKAYWTKVSYQLNKVKPD